MVIISALRVFICVEWGKRNLGELVAKERLWQIVLSQPLPEAKRAGRRDIRPARRDEIASFIDRGARQ